MRSYAAHKPHYEIVELSGTPVQRVHGVLQLPQNAWETRDLIILGVTLGTLQDKKIYISKNRIKSMDI